MDGFIEAKSLWHIADHKLEIRRVRVAEPGPYQVRVRVRVCGVCAWDLLIFRGGYQNVRPFPFYFGHEGIGVIEKTGPGVTRVAVGDRVALRQSQVIGAEGTGHMAQFALQSEGEVVPLPADGKPDEHWLVEPVACCVNAVDLARLRVGTRVALVGTGFMGSILLQLLARSPVSGIDVFELRPESLQYARSVKGAAPIRVYDLQANPDLSSLDGSYDMAIESAGVEPAFLLANRLVRKGGTLVIFSRQTRPFSFDFSNWHSRGIAVLNATPASAPDFSLCFRQSVLMVQSGQVDLAPLVTHVAPPEEAQGLFEDAISKSKGYIKGVIRWN
jgi:threonine dehydrogenase-like Zn-dependent dehydrogenase